MKSQNFVKLVLGGSAAGLLLLGGMTAGIDPLLHYHEPLVDLEYPLDNTRYQNNGIIRQYSYQAAIVGTSMTENFKVSQFQELFGTETIKVPLSGESFYMLDQEVRQVLKENPDTKYILRSLDYSKMFMGKDEASYENYPTYLYDDNLLNDVSYVFNKDIFLDFTLKTLEYTAEGSLTPTLDEYCNWNDEYEFGKEAVLATYSRPSLRSEKKQLTEEERESIRENVEQNLIQTALEYPDTEFYLFYPPYSICWWDWVMQMQQMDYYYEAEKLQTELLLSVDNIHVFYFNDQFDMVCNLDNYKDISHYSEEISEQLLNWMKDGTGLLTEENYLERMDAVKEYYESYDYESLFR
jgi:hypothetical protein